MIGFATAKRISAPSRWSMETAFCLVDSVEETALKDTLRISRQDHQGEKSHNKRSLTTDEPQNLPCKALTRAGPTL